MSNKKAIQPTLDQLTSRVRNLNFFENCDSAINAISWNQDWTYDDEHYF